VSEQPAADDRILLSLVLPTYNESGNLAAVVTTLAETLDRILPDRYELIVVDDDSPDKTWQIAEHLCCRYPQVRVLRRQNERGLATAVIRGWQCARGEVLGVIDADLQHPPEIVAALWEQIRRGSDLAAGSRHVEGGGLGDWGMIRRALSRSAQLLGLMVLPDVLGRLTDPMSGCFFVRRSAITGRKLRPSGYKILIEVVGRGAITRINEVGYVFRERVSGASKVSWRLYLEYLAHLVRLRIATLATPQFLQFILVGFSGLFVDMALFYVLSDPSRLAMGLTSSKMIAGEAAIINNFYWNDIWTFRHLTIGRGAIHERGKRFAKFNAICGMGLILAAALLGLEFNYLGINRYLANLIAIAMVTVWNYCLNKQLSWGISAPRESSRIMLQQPADVSPAETHAVVESDRAA